MELRQCRYFIAVVDARSITSAARKLHVVQSAVSHQIAGLERELETKLLVRTSRGVLPTEAGRVMYLHAQAMLKHTQAARESIRTLYEEVRGSVALGLPSSTADVLAVPLLKAAREKLPRVGVSIVEGLGGVLAEQFASGRLDLCVHFEETPPRGFQRLPLITERLHFVSMGGRAALRKARSISLADVARTPLILPPRTNSVRALLDAEAARHDLHLNIAAEMSGIKTMLEAVEEGLANSVMMAANAAALAKRSNVLVLPIRAPVIERTAALFLSEHFPLTPASSSLSALLLETVRDLVTQKRWIGARLA